MHQEVYQEVIEYFSSQEFEQEYHDTRAEFESWVAGISMDHPFYETWVEAYIEYFTLDRLMPTYGFSAVQLYAKMFQDQLSVEAQQSLDCLANSGLGCYRFIEKKEDALEFIHQQTEEPYTIKKMDDGHQLLLKKGDWVIMRIIPSDNAWEAFGAVWHYPKEITHWLKQHQKTFPNRWLFYMDCLARKVFAEKYKHVDLQKIYQPINLPSIRAQGEFNAETN